MTTTYERTATGISVTTTDGDVAQSVCDAASLVGAVLSFAFTATTITVHAEGGTAWTTIPIPGGSITIGR
jgi:hypothetical protein